MSVRRPPSSPGLDPHAVSAWLTRHVDGAIPPFTFELIAAGRSNLTFAVTDGAGGRSVLRRPPLGELLASAHDMRREHDLVHALAGTGVPVPRPLGFCADLDVTGAPFHVMSFAHGVVLRDEQAVEAALPVDAREGVAYELIDVLADLHAVDVDAVGLGDFARRGDYVGRQLRRWQRQWLAVKTRAVPEIDEAHDALAARVPEAQRLSLVHGDYRLDNVVFGTDGRIEAVLDWELCTLGDPLADLAGVLISWVLPGESADHLITGTATRLPGFPSRDQLVNRYAARSGLDVSDIGFYVGLANWRLACIAEGILARDRDGARGEDHEPDALLTDKVPALARRALVALS